MKKITPQALLLFLALALGFAGWNGWQWGWGAWTESWPSVEGTISSSKVSSYRSRSYLNYFPAIEYRYKVRDRAYIGDDVKIGGDEMSQEDSEAFVARHPPRSRVRVFHHPQQPQRALLVPGAPPGAGLRALVGLGASAILIGLVIWRSRQPADWALSES